MGRLCSVLVFVFVALGTSLVIFPQSVLAQGDEEAVVEDSADGEGLQLIYIAPRVALGQMSEDNIVKQSEYAWLAGLTFRWFPNATSRLSVDFRVEGYDRKFLLRNLGGSGATAVQTNEIRIGGFIDYGYNWLEKFGLELWTSIGWRHDYFDNDYVDDNLSGAYGSLIFSAPLTRWVSAYVLLDYTYNLLSFTDLLDPSGSSIAGQPLGSLRWGAGFTFNINDVTDVGLLYLGEHLPYERSDLLFHYVAVVVGVPIRF